MRGVEPPFAIHSFNEGWLQAGSQLLMTLILIIYISITSILIRGAENRTRTLWSQTIYTTTILRPVSHHHYYYSASDLNFNTKNKKVKRNK